MIVWLIVSIIGLLRIVIEDIKHRSVYVVWFIITLIGVLGFVMSSDYVSLSITNILSNLIICFFVILLTGILYFLKYKFNSAEILRKSIGIGDLLMLPIIIICFSPINFLLFCIGSIIFALLGYSIYMIFINKKVTIPLAGIWSLGLLICLILMASKIIDAQSDDWVFLWLTN